MVKVEIDPLQKCSKAASKYLTEFVTIEKNKGTKLYTGDILGGNLNVYFDRKMEQMVLTFWFDPFTAKPTVVVYRQNYYQAAYDIAKKIEQESKLEITLKENYDI